MRPEIILIGPQQAGKSTIGRLLAERLEKPQISLDKLRWDYYREIGYDDNLAIELRQKGGFLAIVAYWCQFNSHAIERLLADYQDCVFDFGAGPIVFENKSLTARIEAALKPFANVIRLLPSADPERSIDVLRERSKSMPPGTTAQNFDWSAFFVRHEANHRLAKYEVYTDNKNPAETCEEILAIVNQADQEENI